MNHRHPDADPDVYPTAQQEREAMQSDYRRDLIEPFGIIDLMLADMIDAANRRGLDPKPIHDLANHADDVRIEMGGGDD